MREFKVRKGVYIKDNNNTSNMMYTILVILVFYILFAIYKNGIHPVIKGYGNLYLVFKPIIYVLISSAICILTEYIFYIIKKEKKNIYYLFEKSYAMIPGVFVALTISINTPIYLLVIGSIVASLSKLLMGGFGKYKINPAVVGSLFIGLIFSFLSNNYLNPYEMEIVNGNILNQNIISYENLVASYGNLFDFLFGNVPGALGVTSSFLSIISLIFLIYKRIIKWRIPIFYILTVVVISMIICIIRDIGLWFIIYNLLSGGLLFGAVLMATEPVTSPVSIFGQVLGGVSLGIITMLIRYLIPIQNEVLLSILIFNMITILLNYLTIKLYDKKNIKIIINIVMILLCVLSAFIISKEIITY